MAADVSSLLKTLAGLEKRIALLERNQRVNNIGNTSVEAGTLTVTDGAGGAQIALGAQPDGTYAAVASSPTVPGQPSAPVVLPGIQELFITWDGQMADGSTPLADFSAIQVHCSQDEGFIPDATTLQGQLTGAFTCRAGNLLPGVTYWACLEAVNMSGNFSPPSGQVPGVPLDVVSGIAQLASALDVTTAISGVVEALDTLNSGDPSQVVPGILGTVLLGTGTAARQATVIGSPLGANTAAYMLLEAEDDGGTGAPVITFGTVLSPDDGTTLVYTPTCTIGPYYLLLYSGASGQTTVTVTSPGSGTIPVPAGVTAAKAECWGAGGGGQGGFGGTLNVGGTSGAGGEYACEPALAVTTAGVAYTVAAGGAAGLNAASGGSGGATTLTGTSAAVTAHGGHGGSGAQGGTPPAGGTGSANSTRFSGGPGNSVTALAGPGGGSSAGPGGPGSSGYDALGGGSTAGGAGAAPPAGGGGGGAGGNSTRSGSGGGAPGGGGGGAGNGSSSRGGPGGGGQVRLTYTTGAPAIMLSVAAAAGTDQFGTSYPAGGYVTAAGTPCSLGQAVLVTPASQLVNVTSGVAVAGLQAGVSASSYYVRGVVTWTQGTSTVIQNFWFGGPAVARIAVNYYYAIASGISNGVGQVTRIGSGGGATMPSPAFAANAVVWLSFEGVVTFTAAGTFGVMAAETVNLETFTISAGSWMAVSPA